MDWKSLSRKKRLYTAMIFGLVCVLAWAFITAGMITRDFNKRQALSIGDGQEAIAHGIILTETKNEQKYWEIYGETGKWDSSHGIAQLDNVTGNFYKDNEVTMSLESSKGTYDSKGGGITLYDKTFIVLKDGISLNADKLRWVDSKTPIVAEGHIKVKKGNELLSTADKIIISPTYDNFKLEGNTVSKVYEDKK